MQHTVSAWVWLEVGIRVTETEGRTSGILRHAEIVLNVCACWEISVCLNPLLSSSLARRAAECLNPLLSSSLARRAAERLSGVRGQGVREQWNSTGVLNILGVRPVSRILCTTYHIVMYSHNIHIYTTIGCETSISYWSTRYTVVWRSTARIVILICAKYAYFGDMHSQAIPKYAYFRNMHSHAILKYAYFQNMHSQGIWEYAYFQNMHSHYVLVCWLPKNVMKSRDCRPLWEVRQNQVSSRSFYI